jgi:hypothetical protein
MSRRIILMALAAGMLAASAVQAADGPPVIFVPIAPCRMFDSRYVAGGQITNATRNIDVTGAAYAGVLAAKACTAIPFDALEGASPDSVSVELNFTMANMTGPSDLRVAPWGTVTPPTSIMNSVAGLNIAQEATEIVAPDGGGQSGIAVLAGGAAFDLVIDVLGYFTGNFREGEYVRLQEDATNNGYILTGFNPSLNCSGSCGLTMETNSPLGNATANFNNTDGGGERNIGLISTVNSTGDNSVGVQGHSSGASGVNYGVWGVSDSSVGRGVFGDATAPGFSAGSGVYGQGEGGFGGKGVYGLANCAGPKGLCWGVFGDQGSGLYGVYSAGDAYVSGVMTSAGGYLAPITNSFAPYPEDASKEIRYTSAEAPEALAFVRGKAQVVNGFATISLPDHFRLSVDPDSMTVNLTPVGGMASVGVARIEAGRIVIQASRDMRVDYVVYGERSAFRGQQAVVENTHFRPQFEGKPIENWPASYVEIMKQNGVLNADGTVNKATAERLGWKLAPQEANPSSRPAPVDSKKVLDELRQKDQEKRALTPEASQ